MKRPRLVRQSFGWSRFWERLGIAVDPTGMAIAMTGGIDAVELEQQRRTLLLQVAQLEGSDLYAEGLAKVANTEELKKRLFRDYPGAEDEFKRLLPEARKVIQEEHSSIFPYRLVWR